MPNLGNPAVVVQACQAKETKARKGPVEAHHLLSAYGKAIRRLNNTLEHIMAKVTAIETCGHAAPVAGIPRDVELVQRLLLDEACPSCQAQNTTLVEVKIIGARYDNYFQANVTVQHDCPDGWEEVH